jgi:peptide deformylase
MRLTKEIYTRPSVNFDFNFKPFDPYQVSQDMINFCAENKYVSLSACQIGLPYRMFVMIGSESFACFNPKVMMVQGDEVLLDESCPSYPGLSVKIKRHSEVRLRFQTPSGATDTKRFHGLSAKMVLHEMDHLDGFPFYNRASRYHRELAFNKRKKFYARAV